MISSMMETLKRRLLCGKPNVKRRELIDLPLKRLNMAVCISLICQKGALKSCSKRRCMPYEKAHG